MVAKKILKKIVELKYLALLILIYCLVRIPLLLSPLEDVIGEASRGEIAHDLIHGLRLPFWDYSVDMYGIGSLVAGLWTVPFFLIFGENWFALKFAPFVWHLFSLIAWYWIWKTSFSARKAFFISLFFILPPPLIIEYSLANVGYHFEMILWMALSILLLKAILERKISEVVGIFVLGLLCGFASATVLTNLVTAVVILFYVGFYKGRFLDKKLFFILFGISFILGFSPWILLNAAYHWSGVTFFRDLFSVEASLQAWKINLFDLLSQGLSGLFGFRQWPSQFGFWLSILLVSLYLFSFLSLGSKQFKNWFGRKPTFQVEAFGFFFQMLLLISAVFASNGTRPYYLFPLVPFVGMNLVLFLEKRGSLPKKLIVIFWFVAAALGNWSLMHWSEFGRSLSLPPYSKEGNIAWTLEDKFGFDLKLFGQKSRPILANEDEAFKKEFYESLSRELFKINDVADLEDALSYIQETEVTFHPPLFRRLGIALGFYCEFDVERLQQLLKTFSIPEEAKKDIYPGFIHGLHWSHYSEPKKIEKALRVCRKMPKSLCQEGLHLLNP